MRIEKKREKWYHKHVGQSAGTALFYAEGPDFWTTCPEVNQAMWSWKRESFQGYAFELRPNLGRSYERSGVPFGGLDLFPSWEQVRTLYSKWDPTTTLKSTWMW